MFSTPKDGAAQETGHDKGERIVEPDERVALGIDEVAGTGVVAAEYPGRLRCDGLDFGKEFFVGGLFPVCFPE